MQFIFYAPQKNSGEQIVAGLSIRTYVPNSCPAHNLVIYSQILQLFNRNDQHIETMCSATFGSLPWRSSSKHDLAANRVQPNNFVIWSLILQLFHRNDHNIETMCRVQHIWVTTLKVKVTAWPCSKIVFGSYLCYLKSDFTIISQKWSPYWDVLHATFGSLPCF
jgi:hypothetical protein